MRALHTIQILSKIGKVFSKIISICCIVGVCGCAVGALAMLVGMETLKLGGVTLHSILKTEAGVSEGTVWAVIIAGCILCIGELALSRRAHRYFENELKAGTPFTAEGAKELLQLGVSVIWMPLVSMVLAQVARGVIAQLMENVEKLSINGFESVALGVMLIVTSVLCRYGAELAEKGTTVCKTEPKEQKGV